MKTYALFTASALWLLSLSPQAGAIDLARGQRLYNLHCASCHGITGIPMMPDTPNLAMREGMNQPDFMLMQTLKMGKKAMPPYFGILNDQEMLDVIQYIRTIR
ncbi:MAG: cytochrome c [Rhodocyclaceae bacterium]|nr:cytochrome c [Rhodocyclaceae bacterium]